MYISIASRLVRRVEEGEKLYRRRQTERKSSNIKGNNNRGTTTKKQSPNKNTLVARSCKEGEKTHAKDRKEIKRYFFFSAERLLYVCLISCSTGRSCAKLKSRSMAFLRWSIFLGPAPIYSRSLIPLLYFLLSLWWLAPFARSIEAESGHRLCTTTERERESIGIRAV